MSGFRRTGNRNEAFFQRDQKIQQGSSLVTILRHARVSGSLSLTGKDLSEIPIELFANELEEGEKFWECEPITQLDLSFNQIREVGPQMGAYAEAVMMKFRGNHINLVSPEVFAHCQLLRHLDLSQNQLRALDDTLCGLQDLRVLLVTDNMLTKLPHALQDCASLQELDLHNNQLSHLPELALPHLKKLRCSKNQLTALPRSLAACRVLEALDCKCNRLESLPSLERLDQLKSLDAMENRLTCLPELPRVSAASGPGSGLELLNVSYNALSALSPAIVLHDRLSDLLVQNNRLSALDPSLGEMASLKLLDASNNSLTDVPYQLGYCRPLSQLLVDGNPIRSIRRTLITRQGGANCTEALKEFLRTRGEDPQGAAGDSRDGRGAGGAAAALRGRGGVATSAALAGIQMRIRDVSDRGGTLDLKSCSLAPLIPTEVFAELFSSNVLASLTELDASNNGLTMVPLELAQTPSRTPLALLNLRKNTLGKGVEGGLTLSWAPPSLTTLDVSQNGLTTAQLDTLLSDLPSLRHLEASNNCAEEWPCRLEGCVQLREVRMSSNRLADVRIIDARLYPNLEVIDLSGNRIKEVDCVEWRALQRLNTLDLSNNDISSPSYQLGFLPALERLSLGGNPIRTIRQAVIMGPSGGLKEFLRNRAPA